MARLLRMSAAFGCAAPRDSSAEIGSLAQRMADSPPNALEARMQLRAALPAEVFRVAGVSFEGRQALLAALQPDQALALVREPDNEHDPNAIRVQTLGGAVVGYVPRDLTRRFQHETTFAHVYGIGVAADAGLYGVQVMVRPSLPPLTLEALPAALAQHASLGAVLPPGDWERLCRNACRAASYRCEVSRGAGAAPGPPLECHERWVLDDEAGVASLAGLQALCPEVHAVKHMLAQRDERRRQEALWTLQAMNEWTVMEAEDYSGHVRGLAARRNTHAWRVDCSWLEAQGVAVPAALRAMQL
ncbi:hypothetical protein WJX81_001972 [Elliptochloris bilobata]|uniref:HIRAN domain-containing protein n=1 Tax=Elliptochloris bilobata TaxID=381761 RepID=A0AAW1RMP1_9CHLO